MTRTWRPVGRHPWPSCDICQWPWSSGPRGGLGGARPAQRPGRGHRPGGGVLLTRRVARHADPAGAPVTAQAEPPAHEAAAPGSSAASAGACQPGQRADRGPLLVLVPVVCDSACSPPPARACAGSGVSSLVRARASITEQLLDGRIARSRGPDHSISARSPTRSRTRPLTGAALVTAVLPRLAPMVGDRRHPRQRGRRDRPAVLGHPVRRDRREPGREAQDPSPGAGDLAVHAARGAASGCAPWSWRRRCWSPWSPAPITRCGPYGHRAASARCPAQARQAP